MPTTASRTTQDRSRQLARTVSSRSLAFNSMLLRLSGSVQTRTVGGYAHYTCLPTELIHISSADPITISPRALTCCSARGPRRTAFLPIPPGKLAVSILINHSTKERHRVERTGRLFLHASRCTNQDVQPIFLGYS